MSTLNSRYDRLPFSSAFQFVLIKPLRFHETQYHPGDVIDRTDGFDDRKLRQLYDNRFCNVRTDDAGNPMIVLTPVPAAAKPAPAASAAATPAATPLAPLPEGTHADDKGEPATAAPVAYHKGFGKWHVKVGERDISGPHTKSEALLLARAA